MQKRFRTFHDYHAGDPDISTHSAEFPHLRVSHLIEADGDVRFLRTDRSGVVMTLDGSARHLTRMDGIRDETPSRPGEVSFIPEGIEVHLAWVNHRGPVSALAAPAPSAPDLAAPDLEGRAPAGGYQHSVMIDFDAGLFETFAPEVAGPRLSRGVLVPANYAERPVIAGLMRLLAREIDPAQRRGRLFADTVIRLIALELAASHWSVPVTDPDRAAHRDARVHRAIDYVEANFARDISLVEIAAAANLSPTHLTTVFQRETGYTPYAYVIERRLREAVKILRGTDVPIAQVAFATGFADQQHMTRVFRARLGTTPRAVRRG